MAELHKTPCSRSCGCWSPFGVCGRKYACEHHAADAKKASKAAAERSLATDLEIYWPDTRRSDGRRRP